MERSIQEYLDLHGIFNWPTHAGQIIPVSNGISDIMGILPGCGKTLAIEVKHPGWKPPGPESKAFKHYQEQKDFIDKINSAGGVGFFATSLGDVIGNLQIRGGKKDACL